MRGKNKYLFCTLLSVFFIIFVRSGQAAWINSPLRGHIGWYGYEQPKEEGNATDEHKRKIAGEKQGKQEKQSKEAEWPTPQKLYNMYPEEIQKWINRAADEAIRQPTEENVKRWIEYYKIADQKATEFTGMWSWVMQQNPNLYKEAALYPTVQPGNKAFWKSVWQDILTTLNKKYKNYALLFFSGDDNFSKSMRFILYESFKTKHPDWIIKEINIRTHPEVARKFNINYVPQIWLLPRKNKKPVPIAAGPISVMDLEKKIYHTIQVIEHRVSPEYSPLYDWQIPKTKKNTSP